jgi:hypothetical protein
MLFDEKFITELKDDPVNGVVAICNRVYNEMGDERDEWSKSEYETLGEALALLESMIDAGLIQYEGSRPEITGNQFEDCVAVMSYIRDLEGHYSSQATKLKFDQLKSKFKISLGGAFCYEFSQGDLSKIQSLLNDLREKISESTYFEAEHQQRLLRRLEKLQAELHKKVSDLDRFWGLIGDAGVVLGKFGEDAKPLVDRIKEIAEIVWQTQSRAEELPSGTPIPLLAQSKDINTTSVG